MKGTFQMSNLSIKVHQEDGSITLCQAHYAKHIIRLGGMGGCNSAHTLMEERLKLSCYSEVEEVEVTQYQCLVGSLCYLVHTRSDLAFTVRYVSRFMELPMMEHQQAIKRILRYVVGTLYYGLWYERCLGAAHLIDYCDSNLADDIDTIKSMSDVLFFLSNCPISWQSLKQRVVALSSCEVEYIAATSATTQALWLAHLLSELLD
jgi:hypothetical protein